VSSLTKAYKAVPDLRILALRSESLRNLSKYSKARKDAELLLESPEFRWVGHYLIGEISKAMGATDEALGEFRLANREFRGSRIDVDPDFMPRQQEALYCALVGLLLATQHYEEAASVPGHSGFPGVPEACVAWIEATNGPDP